MTNEELLKEIKELPSEARRQVERFVTYLKNLQKAPAEVSKKNPLRDEEFVGMWADREDMKDSVEWVRKVRQTQWNRNR